jgi:UDP-N-acetylglucosamine 2-epimerase (non-hydrolysing)
LLYRGAKEWARVEGGIGSGDWTMPEEINRMVTDAISNWFFTTSETANRNLRKSDVSEDPWLPLTDKRL